MASLIVGVVVTNHLHSTRSRTLSIKRQLERPIDTLTHLFIQPNIYESSQADAEAQILRLREHLAATDVLWVSVTTKSRLRVEVFSCVDQNGLSFDWLPTLSVDTNEYHSGSVNSNKTGALVRFEMIILRPENSDGVEIEIGVKTE